MSLLPQLKNEYQMPAPLKVKSMTNNEPTVRVTIDIPESLYLEMKHDTVSKRQTVRKYFLNLLKKELKE